MKIQIASDLHLEAIPTSPRVELRRHSESLLLVRPLNAAEERATLTRAQWHVSSTQPPDEGDQ